MSSNFAVAGYMQLYSFSCLIMTSFIIDSTEYFNSLSVPSTLEYGCEVHGILRLVIRFVQVSKWSVHQSAITKSSTAPHCLRSAAIDRYIDTLPESERDGLHASDGLGKRLLRWREPASGPRSSIPFRTGTHTIQEPPLILDVNRPGPGPEREGARRPCGMAMGRRRDGGDWRCVKF